MPPLRHHRSRESGEPLQSPAAVSISRSTSALPSIPANERPRPRRASASAQPSNKVRRENIEILAHPRPYMTRGGKNAGGKNGKRPVHGCSTRAVRVILTLFFSHPKAPQLGGKSDRRRPDKMRLDHPATVSDRNPSCCQCGPRPLGLRGRVGPFPVGSPRRRDLYGP